MKSTGGRVNVVFTPEDYKRFSRFCNKHMSCTSCQYLKMPSVPDCMDAFFIDTDRRKEDIA